MHSLLRVIRQKAVTRFAIQFSRTYRALKEKIGNCGDDSYLVLKLSLFASFVKLVRPLISEWKITLSVFKLNVKYGQSRDKYCKDWYCACETLECESEQDQPKGHQDLHGSTGNIQI